MILERDVEGFLVRKVEEQGGRCEKFNPDNDNGMPDRIVMLPGGLLIWVETKRAETEHKRKLQQAQCVLLRRLGQRVATCHTKAEVLALLASVTP